MATQDLRIPVTFAAESPGPDDALFTEGTSFQPSQGHAPGCQCCVARNPAGVALAALIQARAKGQIPFFRRVVVQTLTPEGRAMVEAALATDPVTSLCFRK